MLLTCTIQLIAVAGANKSPVLVPALRDGVVCTQGITLGDMTLVVVVSIITSRSLCRTTKASTASSEKLLVFHRLQSNLEARLDRCVVVDFI